MARISSATRKSLCISSASQPPREKIAMPPAARGPRDGGNDDMKIRLGLIMALALAPLSASAQELRFGYPATPAGAIGIVGNALGVWKRHDLDLAAVQTAAAI